MRPLAVLVLSVVLAGCATPAPEPVDADAKPGEVRFDGSLLHSAGRQQALSLLHVSEGPALAVTFPPGVLVMDDAGRLRPAAEPIALARGELVQYLPPFGATSLNVTVDVEGLRREVALALEPAPPLVSGARVVDLMRVQEARFAHRTPGHENYSKAVAYFEGLFVGMGYETETFRAPSPVPLPAPLPLGVQPASLTSVLGYKRGIERPERLIVVGGHFDVVEQTTHGAFDNTGGSMAVLALAEAFTRFETRRTIVFALWGGEEDGIVGSQAWLTAHPELVPFIDLYVNFDVSGLSWPAPAIDPAAIVVATGPDGPVADVLAQQHAEVVATWLQLDVPVEYEHVARGQAAGAGVNAQSDHTPFMARGVPVVFQFTSRVDDALAIIHQDADTLANLTRYALLGPGSTEVELAADEQERAEALLAASYEAQMVAGFYMMVLADGGIFPSPRPPSLSVLEKPRS